MEKAIEGKAGRELEGKKNPWKAELWKANG